MISGSLSKLVGRGLFAILLAFVPASVSLAAESSPKVAAGDAAMVCVVPPLAPAFGGAQPGRLGACPEAS
jgi:hypothetical protein